MFGGILKEEYETQPIVAISGGFDPLHHGHVRMIKDASKHGGVVVLLNSDEWLVSKKGYCVSTWDARAEVLMGMKGVFAVVAVEDTDGTVCKTLEKVKPTFFANGGDRTAENTPELKLCCDLGIKTLFGVGGEKVASSSDMIKKTEGNQND